MSKKYDYRLVHSYRSYKVNNICRLYKAEKLHQQTVRGWINEGKLKATLHGKTLYIYGAVLKEFLKSKRIKNKRTLEFNQFRCWNCKKIDVPLNSIIIKLEVGRNNSILAHSTCIHCNSAIYRSYKRRDKQDILKCFTVNHNALVGLCDSSYNTRKTNVNNVLKKPLSEPLENKPLDIDKKSASATSQTNINCKENIASTRKASIKPEQLSLF